MGTSPQPQTKKWILWAGEQLQEVVVLGPTRGERMLSHDGYVEYDRSGREMRYDDPPNTFNIRSTNLTNQWMPGFPTEVRGDQLFDSKREALIHVIRRKEEELIDLKGQLAKLG